MGSISFIACFSMVIWFIIDRFKKLWSEWKYGKWVTLAVSCALSAACAFVFNLDILYVLEVTKEISILGQIVTVLTFMSGASGVSELVMLFKGSQK